MYIKYSSSNANQKRQLLAYLTSHQSHVCPICGDPPSDLDHDHLTGFIRGALCAHCNKGLGFFPRYVPNGTC